MSQIIMKVTQSGHQTTRQLIIFGVHVHQPFYFERKLTSTPGHLILGVFVKFSGV